MDESLTNRAAAVEAMRAEVEKSNTEARQVAALRKTLADSIAGANFLSDKKRNNPLTVALIDDLSRRLPEDTFLERLQIENGDVQLQGQSKEAAKLISLLGASTCLGDPRLQGQIQPDARTGKERFQIVADIKSCNGNPADVKMPRTPETTTAKHDAGTSSAPLKTRSRQDVDVDSGHCEEEEIDKKREAMAKDAAARREAAMQADREKAKRGQQRAPPPKEPDNGGK